MTAPTPPSETDVDAPGGPYSRYLLGVLVLVYLLNFLDRQIISILAEDIKADLGISDADIGFLYGTAFAVFYAIFGIPLGRLADVWSRRSLISLGLGFWSLMTALSGFAQNATQLTAARVGVGVGEASATPAAFSMLSDSFPPRMRATVLAIYSSGVYLGAGFGLLIGGQIVERWNVAYPAGGAPFGLAGWQAAYLAVGLPGLLLAIWVRTLREPRRGAADGIVHRPESHPFRAFFLELRSVLPPFTLWHLAVLAGSRAVVANLGWLLGIAGVAVFLAMVTGDWAQWIAVAIGAYASVSWSRALGLRDAPTASLVFGTPSLRYLAIGFALLAFTGYGVGGFTPLYFMRIHGQDAASAGTILGITSALAGLLGVTSGGWLADRMRRRSATGRIQLGIILSIAPIPLLLWMLGVDNVNTAFAINVPLTVLSSMWIGAGASTVQDLVLPRMRAIASAFYILVITLVGFALGPYTIGLLSDLLGDLAAGMRWAMVANVLAGLFLFLAAKHLAQDEASMTQRAILAGEEIEASGDDGLNAPA